MFHQIVKRRRLAMASAVLAAVTLLGAACGSSKPTSAKTTGGSSNTQNSKAPKNVTIAFATYSEGVVFDVALVNGMKEQAKAMGVNLIVDNANGDAATQANQIRTLILQHVNGVLVTPVDSAAIDPSILALNQANIPVVGVSAAPTAGKIFTTITVDTYKAGYDQGMTTIDLLKKRYGSAKGNVVFGEGTPTVDVAVKELNGFKAALQPYPNVHLIQTFVGNYVESDAYNAFLAVLAAHPQGSGANAIDVAVGADDNIAAGIAQAITHLGRNAPVGSPKQILIMGADGSPTAVQNLENGQWSADIAFDPVTGGKDAVIEMMKAIEGQPSPGPNFYQNQPILTPANVAASGVWGLTYK